MNTSKKLYAAIDELGVDLSFSRLYGSIGDARYCKNLFEDVNRDV